MSKQSTIKVEYNTSIINATDEVVITGYFNGTGIPFPFSITGASGVSGVFDHLEIACTRWTNTTEYYYNQMDLWEATLCANTKNGYMRDKTILDIVEMMNNLFGDNDADRPIDAEDFQMLWCVNVYYLLKRGRIANDKMFGFEMCTETRHEEKLVKCKAEYKATFLCGVCAVKSTQKCERCEKTYYCCREHQVADWKEHKKVCIPAVANPLKLKKK
jgi:hypothetical protein